MNSSSTTPAQIEKTVTEPFSITNRRAFLHRVLGAVAAANAVTLPSPSEATPAKAPSAHALAVRRRHRAYHFRSTAALVQRHLPLAIQAGNGDENLYANRIGNFSKGLPHNDLGEADPVAYDKLLTALQSESSRTSKQFLSVVLMLRSSAS